MSTDVPLAPGTDPDSDASREIAAVRDAVRAVRAGDREAFGVLIGLYQRRLFGLTFMMLRNPESAEEIVQDAFLRAFTRLHLYDERRPIYPWLATIAVRLAQNRLRKDRRMEQRAASAHELDQAAAATSSPIDRLVTDDRQRRLWKAVATLPSGQRTAVVLHYQQGLTMVEIANALGVTSGTVKTLLFRARQRLRKSTRTAGTAVLPEGTP